MLKSIDLSPSVLYEMYVLKWHVPKKVNVLLPGHQNICLPSPGQLCVQTLSHLLEEK